MPVTDPPFCKNSDVGNSACIIHVKLNGIASENWTFKRKWPTLIEGIKFAMPDFEDVLRSYETK